MSETTNSNAQPVQQRAGGGPAVTKGTIKTAKRLLNYVFSSYKIQFIIVLICILMSSVASISVSLSLKFLLDDFIIPLIGQQNPDYTELYTALTILGIIFLCGVISTFIYSRMMVVIGQGVLKRVRDEMFAHMQTLPIRYFDQNTNGSIMSLYTNDTDTLRQMINQSIPQVLMSAFTIIVTFISMLALSPILTVMAVLMIGVMTLVSRVVTGNSGKYFIRQQMDLADITGFVEERMNGQRVIKVFNHEKISEREFDELNERLFNSAANAHTFASMMGAHRSIRRLPLRGGHRKYHAGRYGVLPAVHKELYPAVHAGGAAVQLHHHGAGRRGAYLQHDG